MPPFLEGKGKGWITAEYQMHPRSNPDRRESRDGRGKARLDTLRDGQHATEVQPPLGMDRDAEAGVGQAAEPVLIAQRHRQTVSQRIQQQRMRPVTQLPAQAR